MSAQALPGVIPSPNIWEHPDVYELENLGVDPDHAIEAAMRTVHDWDGQHLLDIGCGSGFHLPRWAASAGHVTGVEPHPPLVVAARARVNALPTPVRHRITVEHASAEALPLRSWQHAGAGPLPGLPAVDAVHARWSYFFGPGCETGLMELERVVRPGGTAFIIDNDASRSTFGSWFRLAWPDWDTDANERFWQRQGFTREPVDIRWDFPDRETLEQVVRIEFKPKVAEAILAEHDGARVDYAVNLWWRRY